MTKDALKPDLSTQKQIKYGGFHARICATLIDLFFSILLLFPLFKLVRPFIYNGKEPQEVLRAVTMDAVKTVADSHVPSVLAVFRDVINDTRTHQYFITEGGLWRIATDQFMQIGVCVALYLFFWIKISATPGKVLMSLKIVDAETFAPLTKKQCFIRFLAYIPAAIPLGLGFLWVIFDKKRQGWHDKLAHTVVIKK